MNKSPILDDCVFEKFILADEPLGKASRILETWLLVTNNICGKLFPSSESSIKFDQRFKVTSVTFCIPDLTFIKLWIRQCYI